MNWLLPLLTTALLARPGGGAVPTLPLLPAHIDTAAERRAIRATFDNGLRVLCVENPSTQTVAVSAFINTSARAEAQSSAGIRYFVARALVECSAADQPAIAERIQDLGVELFADASLDSSQVTVLAAAEDVAAAAGLLRDVLSQPQFNEQSLHRLRQQLGTNVSRADEMAEIAADRAAAARLYPGHPFGWPVEGLATSISGFTIDRVQRVYAGSYVPNNMLIVVAGGVPPDDSLEVVKAAFVHILPGNRLPEATEDPLPPRRAVEELYRPGSTAAVHIGARAPGLAEPTYPAVTVALAMLGSGMGSRLYDALRREKGLAYTFAATAIAARDGSRAGLVASCPADRVEETEGRMLLAMRSLTTELASPEEIRRAKEYICTDYAIAHQRSADLAHQLGALELATDRGSELDRELPRLIRQTTPEQVRDAAKAMFTARVRIRVLPS